MRQRLGLVERINGISGGYWTCKLTTTANCKQTLQQILVCVTFDHLRLGRKLIDVIHRHRAGARIRNFSAQREPGCQMMGKGRTKKIIFINIIFIKCGIIKKNKHDLLLLHLHLLTNYKINLYMLNLNLKLKV